MADEQLGPADFARVDESPDTSFSATPRMVAHIDDQARVALATYFADHLPRNRRILDLMSSCVSHLPCEAHYGLVGGLGLNAAELAANPQLDFALVQDLNAVVGLPFRDASFDACVLSVSVQYLTSPIGTFSEIARILAPGATCHVSFSNRMFPTKAVSVWHRLDSRDHARLIGYYFVEAGLFDEPRLADISPAPGQSDPMFVVAANRRSGP